MLRKGRGYWKGDDWFAAYRYSFLSMKSKGAKFWMSMYGHIKQQIVHDFCTKKGLILLENGKSWLFCFIRVGEAANISGYVTYFKSKQRGTLF